MTLQVDNWSYFTLINEIISPYTTGFHQLGPPTDRHQCVFLHRGFNDVKSGVWLKIQNRALEKKPG